VPSLFSAIFSRIRPAHIDARAPQRKVSVVDQQGLRRTLSGQEQAVQVEFSSRVADGALHPQRALPPGSGTETNAQGQSTSYSAAGKRAAAHRARAHWQREFGAAVGAQTEPASASEPTLAPTTPMAESMDAMDEPYGETWAGHSWRTVVAMALRAYTRIFDPDPTFTAIL